MIATYYKGADNRIHADELRMDRNLATRHWDKRFNLGVLGIICVDAYLFFQQVFHAVNKMISCLEFFCKLADELIDNNEGICLTRATAEQEAGAVADVAAASTPTVRRTLRIKHSNRGHHAQGRCSIKGCMKHSIYVCSVCTQPTNAAQKSSGSATTRRCRGAIASPSTSLGTVRRRTGGAGTTRTRGGGYIVRDDSKTTQHTNRITI